MRGEAPQLLGMPAAPGRRLLGRVGENAVPRRNNGQALRYGPDRIYEVAYSMPNGTGTRAPLPPSARTVSVVRYPRCAACAARRCEWHPPGSESPLAPSQLASALQLSSGASLRAGRPMTPRRGATFAPGDHVDALFFSARSSGCHGTSRLA